MCPGGRSAFCIIEAVLKKVVRQKCSAEASINNEPIGTFCVIA
jgi:hypothetical protein